MTRAIGIRPGTVSRSKSAVGYLRRSTDRQEQSLSDQKRAIEAYALDSGLRLVRHYTDDAISGTSTSGRKAFQRLLEDAQKDDRDFDTIVVYDVKRFGRLDNDEAGYYRHVLRMNGVEVRYASENFQDDGTDDLLRPVKQWQAREESKDLSKVTIRGLLSKVEGGWWAGGVPPYGYDLRYEDEKGGFLFTLRHQPDKTKMMLNAQRKKIRILGSDERVTISKKDRAKLVPGEPKRVRTIRSIFKMYVEERRGFKAIADALNEKRVEAPRGPKWARIHSGNWTASTIRAILVNPLYSGDFVWNRRTDARFFRIAGGRAVKREAVHGARLVENDQSDWITVQNTHPGLVSRRIFQQAQEIREGQLTSVSQKGRKSTSGQRSRFILSGLLVCGQCGKRWQGCTRNSGKKKKDGTRYKTFYYTCGGYIRGGKSVCSQKMIPQDQLEAEVIEKVLDHYKPYLKEGGKEKLRKETRAALGTEDEEVRNADKRAKMELVELDQKIENLLDNITPTNRDHVDQRLKTLEMKKQDLEQRIQELDALALSDESVLDAASEKLKLISSLEYTFRNGVGVEKKVALQRAVKQIRLVDGRLALDF